MFPVRLGNSYLCDDWSTKQMIFLIYLSLDLIRTPINYAALKYVVSPNKYAASKYVVKITKFHYPTVYCRFLRRFKLSVRCPQVCHHHRKTKPATLNVILGMAYSHSIIPPVHKYSPPWLVLSPSRKKKKRKTLTLKSSIFFAQLLNLRDLINRFRTIDATVRCRPNGTRTKHSLAHTHIRGTHTSTFSHDKKRTTFSLVEPRTCPKLSFVLIAPLTSGRSLCVCVCVR